ncbi:MAG: hypothetical protein HUJ31_10870, partial [Pseudomonadales bacterium]|nr:hypothetical protein [Pseudomonadales bacterium]
MSQARILEEQIDGLAHEYRVSLDSAPVNEAVDRKLEEIGRKRPIRGFRPGKAPLKVLRNHHGLRVREQVVNRMAIDVARRLIEEKQLEPTSQPAIRIDHEEEDSDTVEFSLLLEVAPTIELGTPGGYKLQRLVPPSDQTQLIDQAEELLRRRLFDKLMAEYDFAVPGDMVDNEYERIKRGFEAEVGDAVDAELDATFREIAERRIRLAILLTEIGRAHEISLSSAEVEALVESRVAEDDPEHQAELIDYYLDHPSALAELQSPMFEERVVKF